MRLAETFLFLFDGCRPLARMHTSAALGNQKRLSELKSWTFEE
jgi:hypothetical protein